MNYIRLNNNDNHLSLGNMFNAIKNISVNKSSAIQAEIFCTLFNIDNISETTVNNYCTGYRAINSEYIQIYLDHKKKYLKDKTILIDTINNLASIIDGYVYNFKTIKEINSLDCLKKLTLKMHTLAKNDIYVTIKHKKEILNIINKNNYYEAICYMLFFIVLEKKQPIYSKDEIKETIEEIISNTNLSVNDLKDYLNIKFKEGINLIPSLKALAKNNNPYALNELGNLEYNGLIDGYPNYEKAYYYHLQAANLGHPTSNWMISNMILNKKIGNLTNEDIDNALIYLDKAIDLSSVSALNTMGLCYIHGYTKEKKVDLNKAINYFKKAANKGYIYAYNNLGKIYEEKKEYETAFNYYLLSAKEEESWACNKVGEFYRQGLFVKKDYKQAYNYYKIGSEANISNRCPWNIYNLVKYFYLPGSSDIGIEKNIDKCLSMLNTIKTFEYSDELFLYSYYELYLKNKNNNNLNKIEYYLAKINNNIILNKEHKQEIEKIIRNNYIIIN